MKKQTFPIRLGAAAVFLLAVLLSGAITLLALWLQPNALRTVLAGFRASPMLIVLNALPVGLTVLTLTFLFRNVFFAAAVTELAVCGLSIANRIKIEVRDEPVFPRDLGLLKEVGSAVGTYVVYYFKHAVVEEISTAECASVGTAEPVEQRRCIVVFKQLRAGVLNIKLKGKRRWKSVYRAAAVVDSFKRVLRQRVACGVLKHLAVWRADIRYPAGISSRLPASPYGFVRLVVIF